jgi:hypothetical protein
VPAWPQAYVAQLQGELSEAQAERFMAVSSMRAARAEATLLRGEARRGQVASGPGVCRVHRASASCEAASLLSCSGLGFTLWVCPCVLCLSERLCWPMLDVRGCFPTRRCPAGGRAAVAGAAPEP